MAAPPELGDVRAPGHEHGHLSPRQRLAWLTSRDERVMAYGVVHHFPGGTKEQYEASIAAVHPSADELPEGQIFHAAGPSPDGWTIMAVHESRASWEKFRDEILVPRMQAGIEGGFATPPEETPVDVYKMLP
jgi:hypothetical protein